MEEILAQFPQQLSAGSSAAQHIAPLAFKRIIVCGMGGSIVPGQMLSMIRQDVMVHSDYGLPHYASAGDLVVCISWSGNTAETVSAFEKAIEMNLDCIALTRGGQLAQKATEAKRALVILPNESISPRTATGYMLGALMKTVGQEVPENWQPDESIQNQAQEISKKIGQRYPLIYSSSANKHAANFWKVLFNENSKVHAFNNWFPRAGHNEITAFAGSPEAFFPIVLTDSESDSQHQGDLKALLAIFDKMRYNYHTIKLSPEGKPLAKILNNYLLALWASYYLAKNLGVNPEDTELIEQFKELKK